MWITKVDSVPEPWFEQARTPIPQTERESLRVRSSYLAAIGEGRELMFVLGVLPPTMLSEEAYLWFMFFEGVDPTQAQLREIREVFPAIRAGFVQPHLLAEVDNDTSERFVQFLGAKLMNKIDDRLIYGWDK